MFLKGWTEVELLDVCSWLRLRFWCCASALQRSCSLLPSLLTSVQALWYEDEGFSDICLFVFGPRETMELKATVHRGWTEVMQEQGRPGWPLPPIPQWQASLHSSPPSYCTCLVTCSLFLLQRPFSVSWVACGPESVHEHFFDPQVFLVARFQLS